MEREKRGGGGGISLQTSIPVSLSPPRFQKRRKSGRGRPERILLLTTVQYCYIFPPFLLPRSDHFTRWRNRKENMWTGGDEEAEEEEDAIYIYP